jgi:hypothetical protein
LCRPSFFDKNKIWQWSFLSIPSKDLKLSKTKSQKIARGFITVSGRLLIMEGSLLLMQWDALFFAHIVGITIGIFTQKDSRHFIHPSKWQISFSISQRRNLFICSGLAELSQYLEKKLFLI